MRIIATLFVIGLFYFLEKAAYDAMSSPSGSGAGLITMAFLAAIGVANIAWIWLANREKKAAYKSPVRPLKH